jgi:hypothetical protein
MEGLSHAAQLDGWIPARFYWSGAQAMVEWCYLGTEAFKSPSFDRIIEECLRSPFNLLCSRQTPVAVLQEWNDERPGLKPAGFVFQMSRSGAAIVSQMLSSQPGSIVLSAVQPIDLILRSHFRSDLATDDQRINWLRWMVSALAQRRLGTEKHLFITFDAWNIFDLPLIQRAFPDVPWLFVYEDPLEVLVSQLGHREAHMVPRAIQPELFGFRPSEVIEELEPEEYCARVLAAICRAALQHHLKGGLLINRQHLPEVFGVAITRFFRIDATYVSRAGANDKANVRIENDVPNETAKNGSRNGKVVEAARHWLYPVYGDLECARLKADRLD